MEVPIDKVPLIPPPDPSWSRNGRRATWVLFGRLYLYDADRENGEQVQAVVAQERSPRRAEMLPDGGAIHFMMGANLFRYDVEFGKIKQLTRKLVRSESAQSQISELRQDRQMEISERIRRDRSRNKAALARRLSSWPDPSQPIPVPSGFTLTRLRLSPDGSYLTFTASRPSGQRTPSRYMDYVTESGNGEVREGRSRVGEPQDELRLGVVRFDPRAAAEEIDVRWLELEEARGRHPLYFGPSWSPDGNRAVIQVLSQDHKDFWIAEVDLENGKTHVLTHDRDDAWLGGPQIQSDRFRPSLLEWLPDGRIVFASERTGWSHLYLIEKDGTIRALTAGEWEVRGAVLSKDRSTWLLRASREHPCEDHLYLMPAGGGPLTRLTSEPGRNEGALSPDGKRLAVIHSNSTQLPDLFLQDPREGANRTRITESGTDAFYSHPMMRPEIVSFRHPDGGQVWAALYKPDPPNPQRAALIHLHGGGDRQFSHRGWSVYGYADHLGLLNYFVQQGFTVLDLDYRGSSGFGRDYRNDIYRSIGTTDVEGVVAAVDFLSSEHGVERSRVGIYGLSYGGFLALMSLFRHPGVFAAGVASAPVTDWVQSSHSWTVRVLNLPYEDREAYQVSSPILHAEGLEDPLLLVHGLRDDNVLFLNTALMVQRLIELEKDFEVMYYPAERHVIGTEESRYDYVRRVVAFFERNLLLK
jgi:dipeptidyl aminopeptidase/acylaminoacyl peptidase